MKRTHKFRSLANVADVVAKASSLSAAAKKLGVNRSTLHRWMEAGKIAKPAPKRGSTAAPETPPAHQSADEWAAALLESHPLNDTQRQLVALAKAALCLARDTSEAPQVQLSAMGRFQQLVRQLNLETGEQPQQQPVRATVAPRRPSLGDPRAVLMAVK
jgi:transposase-like protein